jgi:2-polyprenyl-6-hydroxyphenyl methylase/3-demethylubiquinone-9 3-methyltransferase
MGHPPGETPLIDRLSARPLSKLVAIKAAQQWPLTRLTDVAFHDWDMFIKPAELAAILERHGLAVGETTGLGARATPLAVLRSLARARPGRITYGELSRRLDVGQVSSTAISYMGFATRQRSRPR